jgi:hypothetical protein
MWNRREISARSYYDRSYYLRPHPYLIVGQELVVQVEEAPAQGAASPQRTVNETTPRRRDERLTIANERLTIANERLTIGALVVNPTQHTHRVILSLLWKIPLPEPWGKRRGHALLSTSLSLAIVNLSLAGRAGAHS